MERAVDGFSDASLDFVFSSRCLEHVEEWEKELATWVSKVAVGGVVFLYLPHPECLFWRPGLPFVADGHRWIPTSQVIADALTRLGCNVIEAIEAPDTMQSFYVYARRQSDGGR